MVPFLTLKVVDSIVLLTIHASWIICHGAKFQNPAAILCVIQLPVSYMACLTINTLSLNFPAMNSPHEGGFILYKDQSSIVLKTFKYYH